MSELIFLKTSLVFSFFYRTYASVNCVINLSCKSEFPMFAEVVTRLFEMLDTGITFGLLPLASFLWLFSRMLKGISAFPASCILQMVLSIT